jgi:hypothetical protein
MQKRPSMDNGQPLSQARWANILNKLIADPSKETMGWLDSHLTDSGYTAQDLLKMLNPNLVWLPQGGKAFPEVSPARHQSLAEEPPGSVQGVPFGEGMGLAPAAPVEMSEFQRQQADPTNPAVRLRERLKEFMNPASVREKRHPDEEGR